MTVNDLINDLGLDEHQYDVANIIFNHTKVEIERLRKQNKELLEVAKRLLCHVGLHGMPPDRIEQDAEFAESVIARTEREEKDKEKQRLEQAKYELALLEKRV